MRNIDKNIDKMSESELRQHCKELRNERLLFLAELRAAAAIIKRTASYRLRWLCAATACFLIVALCCYYY